MAWRYFINDAENPPHVVVDSQKTKTGIFHLAHLAKNFNSDYKKKKKKKELDMNLKKTMTIIDSLASI